MTNRRFHGWAASIAVLALLVAACSSGSSQSTKKTGAKAHEGVSVNVLTFTGPQIAEPLQRRAPEFQRLTGAKIKVVTVPFSDLYDKILTDMATKTNSYDAFVFDPQWMGDFVPPGFLEDIGGRVQGSQSLKWNDIAPFFRDFSASYQGHTYTIPVDGDFQMVYYRSDLLKKDGLQPPATWDDYLSIAQRYNGRDLNADGKPDYGSCIAKKRSAQSYWMFWAIAGSFLQTQGTGQGSFFDIGTMKLNLDVGDTRGLFTSGRCALSMDWGDIGTLAIDPKTSTVQDKVGSVILPGSRRVLDRATGQLVDCSATTCPHAVDGVNHAPFAAFGGWSGAINAAAKKDVKDAAFDFLAYMSAPAESNIDVTLGKTGFNPYRVSQFDNVDLWVKAGMSEGAAKNYLGAIRDSLQSPNMILDLRVPKSADYEGVALDTGLAQFLAGELNVDQTMQQIEAAWEKLTNDQGRDKQKQAYAASLNVQR